MRLKKNLEIVFFILYPIAAALFSLVVKPNALSSVFIFFGIPSIYLSFRQSGCVKKAALFSLVGAPFMIFIDYIAHITQTWLTPNTVFSFRLFGYVTIENMLWVTLHLYLVVLFFEHFFAHHFRDKLWSSKTKYLFLLAFGFLTSFLTFYYIYPEALRIRYWYLVSGFVFILLPIILERLRFPHVFTKIIKVVPFFFYLNLMYEIAALKLNWWSFPGKDFIGWINFLGVSFPLEELIFWIILFAISMLCLYEYFDDDEK